LTRNRPSLCKGTSYLYGNRGHSHFYPLLALALRPICKKFAKYANAHWCRTSQLTPAYVEALRSLTEHCSYGATLNDISGWGDMFRMRWMTLSRKMSSSTPTLSRWSSTQGQHCLWSAVEP